MKSTSFPRYIRGFFRNSAIVFLAIAITTIFFHSCQDMDTIGLDLVENPLQFSSTDTVTLRAYSTKEDSLLVSETDFHLLGFISDPLFGKTQATIYTEAIPRTLPVFVVSIPADSLVIDSVVIGLGYAGSAGNIMESYTIRVYELEDSIPSDSVYSTRDMLIKEEITVNNPVFQPLPNDSIYLGADSIKTPPHLRINIDPEFGRRFILHMDSLDTAEAGYSNNGQYRKFFKGLKIEMEEPGNEGAMLYFNLTSSLSKIQFYYKKLGMETFYTYELPLGDALGRRYTRYNNFNHEFAAPIIAQQLNGDTLAGDSLLFLQAMSNTKIKIQLPFIDQLLADREGDIAINSAKLILPVETIHMPDSTNLARILILYREDPENPGQLLNMEDQFVAPGYFGGSLDEDKMEFFFNITRHLQLILDDPEQNTPLYLRVSGSAQNAGRIVLKGPGRETPLKLEINYTQPSTTINN